MLKKLGLVLLLVLIWVAASRSLWPSELFKMHDFIHGSRIAEMTIALRDGQFPVRWSSNFGYGYGMPLFEFYAPLPFYVGAAVYWLTGNLVFAIKFLFGLANALTLLGAFWLGAKLFGRAAGLVTAALFTLAPYRAVNLYVRGAISEAWGMMAMPWILLTGMWVIDKRRYGWLGLVISVSVLMLSHNLTTLMFVPLSCIFIFVYWYWQHRQTWRTHASWSSLLVVMGSYILAGAVSAFYMMPAFAEKNLTKIDSILGGYFDYRMHFIYIRQLLTPYWGYGGSAWGVDDGLSFFVGWATLIGIAVVGLLLLWQIARRWRRQGWRSLHTKTLTFAIVLAGLTAVSLYMTLEKSLWLWTNVSFLSFIQFPWRWLGPAALWLALLVGMMPALIPNKIWRYAATVVLVVISVATTWQYFVPEQFLDSASALYYDDPIRVQTEMSGILPDYIPHQMPGVIAEQPLPRSNLVVSPAPTETPEAITVLVDRTHQKLLQTTFAEPTVMELYMADFPGWRVEVDGQPAEKLQTESGTIAVAVPAESHTVGVVWGSTPVRQLADSISVVAVLVILYLLLDPVGIARKSRHD